jgi:hypothetical protein
MGFSPTAGMTTNQISQAARLMGRRSYRVRLNALVLSASGKSLSKTVSLAGARQRKVSAVEIEVAKVSTLRSAPLRSGKHGRKHRGIYEKVPSSGVWWVRYSDSMGRIRREKAGTKGAAIKLYQKRKTEALQGTKLPESLRAPKVSFAEIAHDALAYSKMHKRTY